MFIVKYNWDNAAPPKLKSTWPIKYSTLYSLTQEIVEKELEPGVWLGIHPTQGLVSFRAWDDVEKKWFCSRASYFNTNYDVAIVECPVGCTGNVYWTLAKIQERIKHCGQDIRFFKVEVHGEISYIPYELHHENEVRTKLAKQHGYTILEDVPA